MAPRIARCIDCNYPLGGIEARQCPECGRAFNPDHPGTMNLTGREIGAVERFLLRPRLTLLNLMALATSVWTLWLYRWPDQNIHYSAWTPSRVNGMWLLLFAVWAGLLITLAALVRYRKHLPAALYAQRPVGWLILPLIAAGCWGLLSSEAPFKVMWRFNRGPLEAWARRTLDGELKVSYPDRWIGGIYAKHIYTDGLRVGFDVTDDPTWCIVRVPPGVAFDGSEFEEERRLDGDWFLARRSLVPAMKYPHARLALLRNLAADRTKALRSIKTLVDSLADDQLESTEGFGLPPYSRRLVPEQPASTQPLAENRGLQRMRPDAEALIRLGDQALPMLSWAMTSQKPALRFRATRVLGQMDRRAAPARPQLIAALADQEYPVREAAAYALAEIGPDASATAPLAKAMSDPWPGVRYNALVALRKLGVEPRDHLQQYLGALGSIVKPSPTQSFPKTAIQTPVVNSWDAVRWNNLLAFTEITDALAPLGPDAAGATSYLIEALKDERLRAGAVAALRRIGPPCVAPLTAVAGSDDASVALPAARALAAVDPEAAVEPLIRLFKGSGNIAASDAAGRALIELGPLATPRLIPLLNDGKVRLRVARILCRSDPERADLYAPVIIESMKDEDVRPGWWNEEAARLSPQAIPYLVRALDDPVRGKSALNALEAMGGPATPALARVLRRQGDWRVTCDICERLAKLKGEARPAMPALLDLLEHPSPMVRSSSLKAIAAIGVDDSAAARIEELLGDKYTIVRDLASRVLAERGEKRQ